MVIERRMRALLAEARKAWKLTPPTKTITPKRRAELVAELKKLVDEVTPIAKDSDDFYRRIHKSAVFKGIVQEYGWEVAGDIAWDAGA